MTKLAEPTGKEQKVKEKSDEELVASFKKGDEKAFNTLYDRYYSYVLNVIYTKVHNKHVAEDLTQEVFIKVINGLSSYEERGKFKAWLNSITNNEVISWIRKQREMQSIDDESNQLLEIRLQSQLPSPLEALLIEEEIGMLYTSIEQIGNAKNRLVLKMRLLDEMSLAKIAEALDCSYNSVKIRACRAVMELKEIIRKKMGEGE